jgi:hypothetical protein
MTLMAGLLAPFFCPFISWMDTFEIARAGESSPLMFRVFEERPQIGGVLHMCKALKQNPVLELAHEGPKRVVQLVVSMVDESQAFGENSTDLASNFLSYFVDTNARQSATQVQAFFADPRNKPKPDVDLYDFASALPAWTLLTRDSHSLMWASRHDELAVILKNAPLPGLERHQRRAAQMMEEAIVVFEEQGAGHDAAIAKSNLGNLISKVEWLSVDERYRRAMALYDSAVQTATERRFRALLMDNIAGRLGEAANHGFPGSRRKALEMSTAAAQELEAIGETERLPFVLSNVVLHLAGLRDESDTRKEDLQRAREIARRALVLLQQPNMSGNSEPIISHLKHILADLLVRSVDYEPDRKAEFASEALQLMDSADE